MAAKPIIIFDFDRTLIEADCDAWIISQMHLIDYYNKWRNQIPWISLMNMLLDVLHSKGKTVKDIYDCLTRIPMDPQLKVAIHTAHHLGCILKIVSNANTFYIETILKKHGLYTCFSEIISNGFEVTREGKLIIIPYHVLVKNNSCVLCPPNMCKGSAIQSIQASLGKEYKDKKAKFIYVGDRSRDYCAILKLQKWDYVMPHTNSPWLKNILEAPNLIDPSINECNDGEKLVRTLMQLIDIITFIE